MMEAMREATDAPPTGPIPEVPGVAMEGLLGSGGFGAVWRGRHEALDVLVAVKVLGRAADDAATLERALREARLMARLDHPNLLRIFDAGRVGPSIFLILEHMDGGSLAGRHEQPADRLIDLARQLLSGLQALHHARILHRDIKPANCLLRRTDDRVKLADLGVAVERGTSTAALGRVGGTLPFLAPELLGESPRADARTDLYALGMTLTSLALTDDPCPRVNVGETIAWIREGERPRIAQLRPDVAPAFARIVERMIARDREDRPASATEALLALTRTDESRLASSTGRRTNREPAPEGGGDGNGDEGPERIGPWVLGECVYEGTNWRSLVVQHVATGAPAQLGHLLPASPLVRGNELILASAERASRFDHEGVLPVLDWGEHEERAWVVTAPRGRTLRQVIDGGRPLHEAEALRMIASIAAAVGFLHERGLVYQIVEPGALLTTRDGRGVTLGWPVFCVPSGSPRTGEDARSGRALVVPFGAPEAFDDKGHVEPAVDIWGLGETLHYLLTGEPAFGQHESLPDWFRAKATEPFDPRPLAEEVTRPTAALLASLLAIEPKDRPESAHEVAERADRIARRLRGDPSTTPSSHPD